MAEDFQATTIQFLQNRDRFVSPRAVLTGIVVYKASQADGDEHIILAPVGTDTSLSTLTALRDAGIDFVVCEIIPEIPMPKPTLHSVITAKGIARWDVQHGWPELHPLLEWS